jgi:hypothetical protein
MERNDRHSGFEQFLRDKSEQHKLYPSDRVWSAINQSIHPRRKWPYAVVTALFIGLGIGGNIHDSSIAGHPETRVSTHRSIAVHVPIAQATQRSGDFVHISPVQFSELTERVIPSPAPGRIRPRSGSTVHVIPRPTPSYLETAPADVAAAHQDMIQPEEEMNLSAADNESVFKLRSRLPETVTANLKKISADLATENGKALPRTTAIRVLKPYKQKFGLQFYVTPTVSYRNLSGQGMKTFNSSSGTYNLAGDVNSVVAHSPMLGSEAGVALVFSMNKKLRFRTGVQFNMSQYEMQAYNYNQELVPMTNTGIGHSEVNAYSTLRTMSGFSRTTIRNRHTMISIPVGAEVSLYDKRDIQFNVAGSIQPTFMVNNRSYMISSDLKNYAQAPTLYRNFNLNSALEAFISVKKGNTKYNFGPQVRYQLMSSFQKEYPISEHLLEYGFKVGMTRTIQ